jgi:hypothetical protein
MSTERDTHFKGFAKRLWTEIVFQSSQDWRWAYPSLSDEALRQAENIIAQRAYDFASHVLDETTEHELWAFKQGEEELENIVPDFTEWPKPD